MIEETSPQSGSVPGMDKDAAPHRVQLSRKRGWRMPENTVKVTRGRGMKWGNPFIVGRYKTAAQAVRQYRAIVTNPMVFFEGEADPSKTEQVLAMAQVVGHIEDLRGKNLACWCALDQPCHADVLLELANTSTCGTSGASEPNA